MESPLAIAVAPNGARRTRADHPALPMTGRELAAVAKDCLAAGAAMIHVHVRDGDGRHVLDAAAYRDATAAIRRAVGSELVVQITTEAVGRYSPAEQMAVVRDAEPEAVSLALTEIVPDTAAEDAAREFLDFLAQGGIQTQFILYSATDLERYRQLREREVIPRRLNAGVLFVLGRYADEQRAVPADLLEFVPVQESDPSWAVCAFGPLEYACCLTAAAFGGDVRVGFENSLWLRDGRVAPDNAALVAEMREAANMLGRPLADADELRSRFRPN